MHSKVKKFCLRLFLLGIFVFIFPTKWVSKYISKLSFFHIHEISVEAQWPLEREKVQVQLNKLLGKSLLFLEPKDVKELVQNSWVEEVVLKKVYPKKLKVSVTTKRAVAVWVEKGQAYYLDERASKIDRASFSDLNLPVISVDKSAADWDIALGIRLVREIQHELSYPISQILFNSYPFFRVFLENSKLELLFRIDNWKDQLPLAKNLIDRPLQIKNIRRINLTLAKKAVVS